MIPLVDWYPTTIYAPESRGWLIVVKPKKYKQRDAQARGLNRYAREIKKGTYGCVPTSSNVNSNIVLPLGVVF